MMCGTLGCSVLCYDLNPLLVAVSFPSSFLCLLLSAVFQLVCRFVRTFQWMISAGA